MLVLFVGSLFPLKFWYVLELVLLWCFTRSLMVSSSMLLEGSETCWYVVGRFGAVLAQYSLSYLIYQSVYTLLH